MRRVVAGLSIVYQTGRMAWSAAPRGLVGLILLSIAGAALQLSAVAVGKQIIDAIVAAADSPHGERNLAITNAQFWVALECLIGILLLASERAAKVVRQMVEIRLTAKINVLIMQKSIASELSDFENHEFYEKLVKAQREASSRPIAAIVKSLDILRSLVSVVGYFAIIASYSWWMAVVLTVVAFPVCIGEARFITAAFKHADERSAELRRVMYITQVLGSDVYAKEVKMSNLGPTLVSWYSRHMDAFYVRDARLGLRRGTITWLYSVPSTLALYGCYGFIVWAATMRFITIGELTLYAAALRQAQSNFHAMLMGIGLMYEDHLYIANLFAFIGGGPDNADGEFSRSRVRALGSTKSTMILARPLEQGIRFDSVGFRYRGSDPWALKDVSFFVPAGTMLAVVGGNGSGKTTLIKLLTGLYPPSEGRVLVDGISVSDWNPGVLRKRFGLIFQDYGRFQFPLKDNVGFGDVENLNNIEQIARSLELAGGEDLIASLPDGLKTQLGMWFPGGIGLSGGQWQKIAIARSLMNENADILVLDEPTSALDPEAEFELFERLRLSSRTRTTVLISHRVSVLQRAEHIVVLKNGRVIEMGSHQSLSEKKGAYARLLRLEAIRIPDELGSF